jgi:hypothetical protein
MALSKLNESSKSNESKRTGIRDMYGDHRSVTCKAQNNNRKDKQDQQPKDTESIHLNAPNQHRPNTRQPIIMVLAILLRMLANNLSQRTPPIRPPQYLSEFLLRPISGEPQDR